MTDERPDSELAPPVSEPVKPSGFRIDFSTVLLILLFGAVPLLFLQQRTTTKAVRALQERPSTLISRDGVFISEVLTVNMAEQQEIDEVFDAFSGRSGGLEMSVLSLWDAYKYMVIAKYRPQVYSLFFANNPPEWRIDPTTKREELHIDGQQVKLEVRNEKTDPPWPFATRVVHIIKVGVDMSYVAEAMQREGKGWIRYIATKDFNINSYGEKFPPDAREYFHPDYRQKVRHIWTPVVPKT